MSDHSHAVTVEAEKFDAAILGGLPTKLLLAGVVGLALTAIGAFISPTQFAYTYLFAFSVFFTLVVGSLFWTCLHHATDSEWSVVVRRQLENVSSLLPYLALAFIPLLFCLPILYKWWNIEPGVDPLLDAKKPFLTQEFFYIRAAAYFLLLGWVAWSLRRLS